MQAKLIRFFGILLIKRCGYGIISTSLFLMVMFFSAAGVTYGQTENSNYLQQLIKHADEKKLYESRYWHVLLHYKRNLFGAKSLIDDENFFLAEDGKYNPKNELHATLKAFFKDDENNEKNRAVCKFIARFNWLKKELNIDLTKLPYSECAYIEKNINENIRPHSISLVFPASHINSPPSMFGHTLLTIDNKEKNKLVSLAVNYAAITEKDPGVAYAFKGIIGSYKGYFGVFPYYKKIQEYSDLNYRDMWEYNLNFNKQEIRQILYHLYELDHIYSYYYFFDENCSYNLLFLLDVAKPSLNLTDKFYSYIMLPVTPVNTIREVRKNGIIKETIYRPSKVTKIKYMASLLNSKCQNYVHDVLDKEIQPEAILKAEISQEEKIITLDLATEMTQYQYFEGMVSKKEYLDLYINVLRARSKLGSPSNYTVPVPERPEDGHGTNRIALGGGFDGSDLYQEIRWRPTYHTLLDQPEGFIQGGQIVFLNVAARFYSENKLLILDKVDLISIISLAPQDDFISSWSWKAITGFRRIQLTDNRYPLMYGLNLGIGRTYNMGYFGLFNFMLETDFGLGPDLEDWYIAGAGASISILHNMTSFWGMNLVGKYIYYGLGDPHNNVTASLQQRFSFNRNTSFILEVGRTYIWDNEFSDYNYKDFLNIFFNLFY